MKKLFLGSIFAVVVLLGTVSCKKCMKCTATVNGQGTSVYSDEYCGGKKEDMDTYKQIVTDKYPSDTYSVNCSESNK